jgi:tripartite-type tricarboxylate transporter receptor subunit TctC
VRAPADGYTLLLVGLASAINATLYEKLNFNFICDIAPVAGIIGGPLVMVVIPSVPAKTVPEFIAYAKANAGKINMASGGTGSPPHMAGELFKLTAGIDLLHVPYRGTGAAYADLLGGAGRKLPSLGRSPRWSTSRAERCAHWRLRQASVGAICQTFQP